MTWEFRVLPGGRIARFPARPSPDLDSGQVRVEFLVGGICGSDIGALADLATDADASASSIVPLHEVVGRVTSSRDDRLDAGQIVVGTCLTGLASTLVERADHLIPIPPSLSPIEAVAIQPLSTVLRAARGLPSVEGRGVVVLGAGAIGLAFVHVLATMGAGHITSVDPIAAREPLARRYGADDYRAETGEQWAQEVVTRGDRPAVVIDAVGRRPALIGGALRAVADGGYVLGFGSAGGGDYAIPFGEMYHRRLTLGSGRTRERWTEVLEEGADYLLRHRVDFADYVSARYPIDDAAAAYRAYAEPSAERVKVALLASA